MLRIAVCDDETETVKIVNKILSSYCEKKLINYKIHKFSDGNELLNAKECFDMIFLDTEMKSSNGIEIGRNIRANNSRVAIVYITSFVENWRRAYKVHAFDFITKPFTDYEIYSVMDDYLAVVHADEERKLMFPTDDGTICLSINDIYYFMYESKKKVYVHTSNERILVKQHLMEIYSNLDKSRFYRSRRDCILNLKYVKKIKNNFVIVMRNGDLLPLAQRKKDEFVAMLTKEYVNSMKGGYKSLRD